MMKWLALSIALLVLIPFVSACGKSDTDPSNQMTAKQMQSTPTTDFTATSAPVNQSPDDVVAAPGLGPQYRANIHQIGVANPWLPIESSDLALDDSADGPQITYRDYIETKAGETRHNIVRIYLPTIDPSDAFFPPIILNLEAIGLPDGIRVVQNDTWHGADPARQSKAVLAIYISADVKQGDYSFDIRIEINNKDHGKVPCTIKVIP